MTEDAPDLTREALEDAMFLVDVFDDGNGKNVQTLSFSRAPTVLLTFAANRYTRRTSRFYQEHFGIGAADWRMLVMLTRQPGASVAISSKTIGIDKGAVSRSLARLEKNDLAYAEVLGNDTRRRQWYLTEKGKDLHAKILAIALKRQAQLLDGMSHDDIATLNGLLARMLQNMDNMSDPEI